MSTGKSYTIEGGEKNRYLNKLDSYLNILIKNLAIEKDVVNSQAVRNFGEAHKWDWTRLPKNLGAYKTLSGLAQRIRQEYWWFDWKVFNEDPSKNYGYFEQLNISPESGLPWVFDFVELHRLKKEAKSMLEKKASYAGIAKDFESLLLGDCIEISEVSKEAEKIHKEAMNISFLEKLKDSELLGWKPTDNSLRPIATKILPLGGEELWNIKLIRYSRSKSLFYSYIIDLWQDNRDEPQIVENGSIADVSQELINLLRFSEDTSAWYALKSIDENFRSLHPVHVSKAIVGPFENKYFTNPASLKTLQVTKDLLKDDPEFGMLRFNVQYTLAPNHENSEEVRQIIYREDWQDEFIVCPAHYSSRVSSSVLGERVRVLEA